MTNDLTSRLESSTRGLALTEDVKSDHLAAIEASLERATVVPLNSRSHRRRFIAAVTAAALIGPTGLAAASDDALPGDALYGVKQVSEHVTSLFDDEIVPRHRVEEAEKLTAVGDASRDAALDRALDAVAGLDEDHELRQRLAALTAAEADDHPDDADDPTPVVEPDDAIDEPAEPAEDEAIDSDETDTADDVPAQVADDSDDDHDPSHADEEADDEPDHRPDDDESTGD